jgi:MFS family permease
MTSGPVFALIQTIVPERTRATAVAVLFLAANLIGLGLGPLAAGALSDLLHPFLGEESMRYTLLILSLGYVVPAWQLWSASKTVAGDLKAVELDRSQTPAEHGVAAHASTP